MSKSGEGGLKMCIKIGKSETTGTEKREGSPSLARNAPVFSGDVTLDYV